MNAPPNQSSDPQGVALGRMVTAAGLTPLVVVVAAYYMARSYTEVYYQALGVPSAGVSLSLEDIIWFNRSQWLSSASVGVGVFARGVFGPQAVPAPFAWVQYHFERRLGEEGAWSAWLLCSAILISLTLAILQNINQSPAAFWWSLGGGVLVFFLSARVGSLVAQWLVFRVSLDRTKLVVAWVCCAAIVTVVPPVAARWNAAEDIAQGRVGSQASLLARESLGTAWNLREDGLYERVDVRVVLVSDGRVAVWSRREVESYAASDLLSITWR